MEHNLLFSIIVPIYNAGEFLSQCLDSITNQTYTRIEIILINDGSIDNSADICDKYSTKDSRVKVIHTENRGVSCARNLGLSVAQGDYIVFIDSDDWLEKGALDKVHKKISHQSYDLIIYGVVKETSTTHKPMYNDLLPCSLELSDDIRKILPTLIRKEIINPPFKVYKHELIKSLNIKFQENLNIAEDYLFNMICFLNAESLLITNEILYHYMIRNNLSLTRKFQEDKYQKLMKVNDKLSEVINEIGDFKEINEAIQCIRLKNIYSCFMDMFNAECKYSYREKLLFIEGILIKEKNKDYSLIKDRQYKILLLLLKLNNSKLIYIISKSLYMIKLKKL